MKLTPLLRSAMLVGAVSLIPATTAGLAAVDGRSSTQFERLETVYKLVKLRYVEKVDDDKLEEGAIDGMLSALDPHSSFLSGATMQRINTMIDGNYSGLGLSVVMDTSLSNTHSRSFGLSAPRTSEAFARGRAEFDVCVSRVPEFSFAAAATVADVHSRLVDRQVSVVWVDLHVKALALRLLRLDWLGLFRFGREVDHFGQFFRILLFDRFGDSLADSGEHFFRLFRLGRLKRLDLGAAAPDTLLLLRRLIDAWLRHGGAVCQ